MAKAKFERTKPHCNIGAKTTVRNDTKMQMSIIVSENRGT